MRSATELSRFVHELAGQRKRATAAEKECACKVKQLTKRSDAAASAQTIIQAAAKLTQQQLEYRISELATLALKTVFPDPYTLEVSFEEKRGRTECVILLRRDFDLEDVGVRPMEACGHGVLDVVGLALRLSLWSLRKPRAAPVFILDEPFRNISRDYLPQVATLLKELSARLGIQFILVTHEEEIAACADKAFRVTFAKTGSKVIEI
jgi:DNA repair exonuclease SbcCD ATPase subunit